MGTVHCTNGHWLLLLALRGLAQSEGQQEGVRAIKHRIVSHRIDPIAREEDESPPFNNELIEPLTYLGRERLDVAEHDNLIVIEALLFQSLPGNGIGVKQR